MNTVKYEATELCEATQANILSDEVPKRDTNYDWIGWLTLYIVREAAYKQKFVEQKLVGWITLYIVRETAYKQKLLSKRW